MSQRFISTSFWDDSWVQELSAEGKLLYMYLLTNPLTNIAGVYKITVRRISFDTGMVPNAIKTLLAEFEQAGKAAFVNEYIILPNWPKHQKLSVSGVRAGLERILKALPAELFPVLNRLNYQYPIKDGSAPLEPPSKALEPPIKEGSTPLEPPLNRHTNTLDSKLKLSSSSSARADDIPRDDPGLLAYALDLAKKAKARNPGAYARTLLDKPDVIAAYRESLVLPEPEPSRPPPPKTCSECGGKITLIAGEAVCGKCGAAWTWYDDWQSWERSPESYQRVDLSALKPA